MVSIGTMYTMGSGSTVDCPSTPKNYREHVGRCERIEAGNLVVSATTVTVYAVRRTPAAAVCTVAAVATMFCSQGGHGRGNDGGKREDNEDRIRQERA